MSVQLLAEASQKFTRPGVTAAPPAVTVAVRVTAVCAVTVVTELPPAVTASVVAVVCGAAHAAGAHTPVPTIAAIAAITQPKRLRIRFLRKEGGRKDKTRPRQSVHDVPNPGEPTQLKTGLLDTPKSYAPSASFSVNIRLAPNRHPCPQSMQIGFRLCFCVPWCILLAHLLD